MTDPQQKWTEKIEAKHSLFDLKLNEVWRYRDLVFMLVKRDFITFYKQTILGPLWFLIQPVLTTIIFVIVFGKMAGLSTDGTPMMLFYLAGNTIWAYFSEGLNKTSTVFRDNADVFGKVYFPRLTMPLSIVISGLIKFTIQYGLFLGFFFYYWIIRREINPNLWILCTPYLVLLMGILSLGLGMIFSSLTTKYKDLVFLLTFGIQLLMYASPVIYPISSVSDPFYKQLLNLNPLTGILECFRYGYLGNGDFQSWMLLYSTGMSVLILTIGTLIFNKVEKTFMDTV